MGGGDKSDHVSLKGQQRGGLFYCEGITGETVALRLLWVLALAFVGSSFHRKMLKTIFHDSMDINMDRNHADFDLMYSLLLHSSFLLILKEIEIYAFPWALKILGPGLVVPLSVVQAAWVPSSWAVISLLLLQVPFGSCGGKRLGNEHGRQEMGKERPWRWGEVVRLRIR